jgi:hypothetical protein
MPKHRNNYEGAAKATVDLVDHPLTKLATRFWIANRYGG